MIDLLEKSSEEGGGEVEPDLHSWSLVVAAWAHSTDPGAVKKSEEVLLRMERWAIAERRKLEKEGALPHHQICLDIDAYNAVLKLLSRSQEHDTPGRALAILKRMIDLANAGFRYVRPTAKSWNSVLNCFSRTREAGIPAKAEAVIKNMIREGVKPDLYSWAAILQAYQKNNEPGGAERADATLRQMQRFYLAGDIDQGPDVVSLSFIASFSSLFFLCLHLCLLSLGPFLAFLPLSFVSSLFSTISPSYAAAGRRVEKGSRLVGKILCRLYHSYRPVVCILPSTSPLLLERKH